VAILFCRANPSVAIGEQSHSILGVARISAISVINTKPDSFCNDLRLCIRFDLLGFDINALSKGSASLGLNIAFRNDACGNQSFAVSEPK